MTTLVNRFQVNMHTRIEYTFSFFPFLFFQCLSAENANQGCIDLEILHIFSICDNYFKLNYILNEKKI